jgi:hypothetical protein
MFRLAAFVALLLFAAVGTSWAGQYGTAEEAKRTPTMKLRITRPSMMP